MVPALLSPRSFSQARSAEVPCPPHTCAPSIPRPVGRRLPGPAAAPAPGRGENTQRKQKYLPLKHGGTLGRRETGTCLGTERSPSGGGAGGGGPGPACLALALSPPRGLLAGPQPRGAVPGGRAGGAGPAGVDQLGGRRRPGVWVRARARACHRVCESECVCVCVRARARRRGCVTAGGSARGASTRMWPERTKGRRGGGEQGGEGAGASRPPAALRDPAARGRAWGAGRAHAPLPAAPASSPQSSPQAMTETNA